MKAIDNNMNIEERSDSMATRRIIDMAYSNRDKIRSTPRHEPAEDGLNVSELARLVSKHANELAAEHKIRPGKVAEFRNRIHDSSDIPDHAVDTIFRGIASL